MRINVFILFILFITACSDKAPEAQKDLLGEWKLNRVVLTCSNNSGQLVDQEFAGNEFGCSHIASSRSYCAILNLFANGQGTLTKGDFYNQVTEDITYILWEENNSIEICTVPNSCTNFSYVNDVIQFSEDDEQCIVTYFLEK